jgi:16S rRNA (cytidine1402-2'-O)-methyltransferase
LIKEALKGQSVRDAADAVAARTGLPRRQVYQLALKVEQEE